MAWTNVEDYCRMASVQLQRIHDNNELNAFTEVMSAKLPEEFKLSQEELIGLRDFQSARSTADAHFYLNCWRIVALNVYRIANAVGGEELKQLLVDQQCPTNQRGNSLYFSDATESFTLGWYAQGRDHFEHIDERIYGGRNWDKLSTDPNRIVDLTGSDRPKDVAYYPSPFFNGKYMIVGNSTWEITPHAHDKLRAVVQEVEGIGSRMIEQQNQSDSTS
jgi:hypothetical protein